MRRIVDFVSGFATETTLALVRTAVDAINAKIPASPATTGKQDTGNTSLASIDGKITACNTGAVTVTTCALPPDAATQTTLAALNGKVTACDTGAVVLATGAATIGKVDQGTGGASAWKVDGSAVTQPVSGSVTATISGTPAVTVSSGTVAVSSLPTTPAGSNTIGAVTGPSAVALAKDSTLTDATQRAGVLGADGATLASAANPLPVTPGTSTLWDVKDRVGRLLGILTGKDGTTAASASNGLPVAPETASTWDVSSRAARLIGAITGANGSGVASVTNAVPVGGKDGSGNAQTFLVNASGVAQTSMAKGTAVNSTAAESSHVISASACLVSRIAMQNANAATRYCQAHNATSLPSNGAVPVAVIIIGTTQTQVMTFNIPTDRFSTGCVVATSTTGGTLTIGSSDALFQVDLFPTNV